MFKFIKLIRAESKNITWPTRKSVMIYSFLVIIISILMSAYLFASDTALKKGVNQVTNKMETKMQNSTDNMESSTEVMGNSTSTTFTPENIIIEPVATSTIK